VTAKARCSRRHGRPDEVGDGHVPAAVGLRHLLADGVDAGDLRRPRLVLEHHDVVVRRRVGRPEPDDGRCGQQLLVDDPGEQRGRVRVQVAGHRAHDRIGEDGGQAPRSSHVAKNGVQSMRSTSSASG
jgi:hypothetical protein